MSERTPRLAPSDRFAVSGGLRMLGYLCHEFPRLWAGIERLESAVLRERLEGVAIRKPIYVTGMARSGTTILLELLAGMPGVVTHLYRDFPPIWTPFLWNSFLELVPRRDTRPHERPHQDGIEITPDSPEAMEEPIWMRFFPTTHDPSKSNLLGRDTRNDSFAAFYRRHIQKLLLLRGGQRYLAKGNYNVSRLAYIQSLFPDAIFIVPIRHPLAHVASLSRQHRNFSSGQSAHPAARAYLRRVGHFEFGMDRVPINMGDDDAIRIILQRWHAGDELAGWALCWSHIYGRLREQLDRDERLRNAVLIVRYEDLNAHPSEGLQRVLEHCQLDVDAQVITELAKRLHPSRRTGSELDSADAQKILRLTEATRASYGYT